MSHSKIPFELLNGRENFDQWEVGSRAYLKIKKLWEWTQKKPDASKADEIAADDAALSELTLLVDPSLYTYVSEQITTKDAWEGLAKSFKDNSTSLNIFTLRKFVTTKTSDFKSIEEYVKEMLKLWKKAQQAGYNIDEHTAGSLMLGGLPNEYRPMILGIKNCGTKITVDYVKNLLLQDIYFDNEQSEENALAVKSNKKQSKKVVKCYNCEGNHFRNKCPQLKNKNNKKNDEKDKVLFCASIAKGKREESTTVLSSASIVKKKNDERDNVLFSALVASEKSDTWYIDSGATSHMTHERNAVKQIVKPVKEYVTAANGDPMKIIGMGDVRKRIAGNNYLTIKNAQIIPNLCVNLLSVSQLVLIDYEVIFNKRGCKIIDKNSNLIATGRFEDNMFKLNIAEQCAYSVKSDNIALWHKRLGHVRLGNMKFLNIKVPSGLKCKVCIRGKQPRSPFLNEGTRATKKLQIVHTDVCGPLKVKSIGGCRFFVTFIDDYTRKVFLYTLKHKSEVFKKFIAFKNFAENQTECKIKMLRSDNGTEFVNNSLDEFCEKNGIARQKTAPYTPQQNSLAERMNRTLLDRVRCMLIDSGLTRGFWAEAINTAVRIINSVPCKGTKDKCPDELWTGKTPNLSFFRVFGCTAFAHIPDQKRTKLDEKGIECTFLGYSDTAKAYRLYCRATKKIITSRDVTFIESEFEEANEKEKDDTFYIDLSETYEPGGDVVANDVRDEDDSYMSADNDLSDQEEQIPAIQPPANGESEENNPSTASCGESSTSAEKQPANTTLDDTIVDNAAADPTFSTKAKVDTTASKAVTRSVSAANPFSLLHSSFVFCTRTPTTPKEAFDSDENKQWLDAMKSEIKSLEDNNTWKLVDLLSDRKAIKNKWVFARKIDAAGNTTKYKARLCAKGFSQREGIDCTETFAPVAKYTSLRYILSLTAEMDLHLTQMDVVSAFLNGPLSEDVYMEQPPYFDDKSNRVCKLNKSLYGLKQSGRNWNQLLNQTLIEFGLTRTVSDQCIYVARKPDSIVIVMIWVDDVLIAYNQKNEEEKLRAALESRFKMKYLGDASVMVGINITRDRKHRTISIDQQRYIEAILNRFGMEDCNPIATPMDVNTKYSRDMDGKDEGNKKIPYREAIGSLLYAAQVTRPDINFSVILLSRFCENPKWAHWMAAKRIMRYLKATSDWKLTYGPNCTEIVGYCDSDYAGDIDDRKSTSGYVFIKNGAALCWQTKKQKIVAQSTAEAEFTSLAFAAKEAIWLQALSCEILGKQCASYQMYCDNKGAVDLAHNNNHSEKTKHIDIKLKFVHHEIEKKEMLLKHIPTDEMLADVLTKSLTKEKHQNCIAGFGLK